MERSLTLRKREPAPSSSNQSYPIAEQETQQTESIHTIKPPELHDVVVSATSMPDDPATKDPVSLPPSDNAVVPSAPGQKRKAPTPAEFTTTPKRAKKTVPTTKSPKAIFPPPVLAIAKHGPVYDSNWYRSVLEEPSLLGYRTDNLEAVFEAYESLLMNQTRMEYDLRRLTGILFGHRDLMQSTPEDEDAGMDEGESSDMEN